MLWTTAHFFAVRHHLFSQLLFALAQIPILAVTGDVQMAGDADAVLGKPWRPQQLLTAATTLLAAKADRT